MTVQYIKTRRELIYRECSGRHTVFESGVPGFVLDENRINNLIDVTERQKREFFGMLENARAQDQTLALLQGKVCALDKKDFYQCEEPKCYMIPNEIF